MKFSTTGLVALLAAFLAMHLAQNSIAQDDVNAASERTLDRLILRSGGELFGQIINEKMESGKSFILFETEAGTTLKIDRERIVTKRGVVPNDFMFEYEKRAATAIDPITHRMVINWCKEQPRGNSFYRNEIEFHWRQILKQDPNDDDAWRALKFERPDGQTWINEEERAAASGYVKVHSKYIPKQLVITAAEMAKREQAQNHANMAVDDWIDLLDKSDVNSSVIQQRLLQVTNELSLAKLFATARDKKTNTRLRRLIIEAIGSVPNDVAAQQLIFFAIHGENLDIQQKSTDLLKQKHYDPQSIVSHVVRGGTLRSQSRDIINSSGRLLAEIGSPEAIVPLMNSLQTIHKVSTGKRPGGMNAASVDGNVQGLDTGGPASEDRRFNNPVISSALQSITGQRFGFDRPSWMSWYIENHSYTEMDMRGDD